MGHVKSMVGRLRWDANPILVKELRSRMRGVRAFAILTAVLLLLGGVSYVLHRVVLAATRDSSTSVSAQVGQTLLIGLALVELLLICIITPALTAGAVSGEQEKLTYGMLLATPLRPASIVWGKLVSALGYVFLLIFAALPMASLVFTYGGVTPVDVLKSLAILAATAVTLGVIGVFASTWLGRTARATAISYLAALGLLIGPLLLYVTFGILVQGRSPRWLLVPSPISALFSALSISSPYGKQISFLSEMGYILGGSRGTRPGWVSLPSVPRPLYHYTLVLYGGLSLVLYLLATRLVRPTRRWHVRWREALGTLILVIILGCVAAVPFVLTLDRYERVRPEPTPIPSSLGSGEVETEEVQNTDDVASDPAVPHSDLIPLPERVQ